MTLPFDRPLSPAKATELIRGRMTHHLTLRWTSHAKERMAERKLLMGDILHVLKNGYVFEEGQPTTQAGCFKYRMESTTPNSGGRTVRVVLIPSSSDAIKIVTVMWRDEDPHTGG